MKLKLRYATYLIVILIIICVFTFLIAKCVTTGHYLAAVVLTALLYGCSFFMGKKFRKVFYLLATIKFVKDRGGVTSIDSIEHHISRGRTTGGELAKEIITLLIQEKVVEKRGENLLLTGE